jgi:hypothetical protein
MEHVQKGRWHLPEDTEMWVGLIEQHACIYPARPFCCVLRASASGCWSFYCCPGLA